MAESQQTPEHPIICACPYLPLREQVVFGPWRLVPLAQYDGAWLSPELETAAKQFLGCFRQVNGKAVKNPALLARACIGVDGVLPSDKEQKALVLAIQLGTVAANPYANDQNRESGWSVATTDNADIWFQPLNLANGFFAMDRGSRVRTTVGGMSFTNPRNGIPPPLELNLPSSVPIDEEILQATYDVLTAAGPESNLQRELRVAIHWLAKAWANSASITNADRLVYLKTATEVLSGTDKSRESARNLRARYETANTQDGKGLGICEMLWSPDESVRTRTWHDRSGAQRSEDMCEFEHWYMAFADARNDVVHGRSNSKDEYQQPGSPYNGAFVDVADRVVRELILLTIGLCGYPAVWRKGLTRASYRLRERLDNEMQ